MSNQMIEVRSLLKRLFTVLDRTEETDEGRIFRPTRIDSVRIMDGVELENVLARLKDISNDKYPRE